MTRHRRCRNGRSGSGNFPGVHGLMPPLRRVLIAAGYDNDDNGI